MAKFGAKPVVEKPVVVTPAVPLPIVETPLVVEQGLLPRGTCNTCNFRDDKSRCRRFPPLAVTPTGGVWAIVKDEDWCGEYRTRSQS